LQDLAFVSVNGDDLRAYDSISEPGGRPHERMAAGYRLIRLPFGVGELGQIACAVFALDVIHLV
jgi:hypothetical protein